MCSAKFRGNGCAMNNYEDVDKIILEIKQLLDKKEISVGQGWEKLYREIPYFYIAKSSQLLEIITNLHEKEYECQLNQIEDIVNQIEMGIYDDTDSYLEKKESAEKDQKGQDFKLDSINGRGEGYEEYIDRFKENIELAIILKVFSKNLYDVKELLPSVDVTKFAQGDFECDLIEMLLGEVRDVKKTYEFMQIIEDLCMGCHYNTLKMIIKHMSANQKEEFWEKYVIKKISYWCYALTQPQCNKVINLFVELIYKVKNLDAFLDILSIYQCEIDSKVYESIILHLQSQQLLNYFVSIKHLPITNYLEVVSQLRNKFSKQKYFERFIVENLHLATEILEDADMLEEVLRFLRRPKSAIILYNKICNMNQIAKMMSLEGSEEQAQINLRESFYRQLIEKIPTDKNFKRLMLVGSRHNDEVLFDIIGAVTMDKDKSTVVKDSKEQYIDGDSNRKEKELNVTENQQPERRGTLVNRIVRKANLVQILKHKYDNTCQVCGCRLEIRRGVYYSEVHHIRPLGSIHEGSDTLGNTIVLCPNCHTLFDRGSIGIDMNSLTIMHFDDENNLKGKPLLIRHLIDEENINYHNTKIYLSPEASSYSNSKMKKRGYTKSTESKAEKNTIKDKVDFGNKVLVEDVDVKEEFIINMSSFWEQNTMTPIQKYLLNKKVGEVIKYGNYTYLIKEIG